MSRKKKCRVCGSLFSPKKKTQILCENSECKKVWKKLQKRKKRSARHCKICGSVFTVSQDSKQLCCGPNCMHEYAKQKKRERYWDDPKTHREKQKSYYRENAEKVKRYVTEWQKEHPNRTKRYKGIYAGMETLTCKHCKGTTFVKLEVGQYHDNPVWLERGLPLAKVEVDEWSKGGCIVYRCFECHTLANKPRM